MAVTRPAETATMTPLLPTLAEMPGLIPDPITVRRMIGFRETELELLHRLLAVSEDTVRVRRSAATAEILIPTVPPTTNPSAADADAR